MAGFYSYEENILSTQQLASIATGIASSKYLGKSPLGPEFVNTLGFSIVFKRQYIDDVISEFPFLAQFFEAAVFPESNAFYINPLVLRQASEVMPHVDCRLIQPDQIRIIPNLVSVLYVAVPQTMRGGELILNVGMADETEVCPRTNSLVHFLGKVIHKVNQVDADSDRISIVCEQYNLDEQTLRLFPNMQVVTDLDMAPRVAMQ